jgi:O-antigen ligase
MNRVSLAVSLFALLFALQFALGSLLTRFEGDPFEDLRLPLNATVFETAFKALPFGTGLGSFVPVYAAVEKGQDTFDRFVHRAHNDFAELFLETGLVGAVLGFAFLAWFGWRVFAIWVKAQPEKDPQLALLERASSLAVALLLFHSLVDYPLRTTALSAVFALFCGILAAPIDSAPLQHQKRRRRTERPKTEALPVVAQTDDIPWPVSWRR